MTPATTGKRASLRELDRLMRERVSLAPLPVVVPLHRMGAARGERDGDGDGNGADGRQDIHTASTPSPCQLHWTRISTGCTDSDSTGP